MTLPMFRSANIFGIHEPGGERYMKDAGHPGWIVFTEGIGSNPQDRSGRDYRPYSNQGFGIITRLNNGYAPAGTIPNSSQYRDFAARCANFVAASPGCKTWIIGNEMNYALERPPLSSRSSRAMSSGPAPSDAGGALDSDIEISGLGTDADGATVEEVTITLDDGSGLASSASPAGAFMKWMRPLLDGLLRQNQRWHGRGSAWERDL